MSSSFNSLKFQDRREAAIEDCSRAIELKPDYVKALVRRGQAYEDSDRPHEAFKDFEKVLEIDPGLKDAKLAVMVNFHILNRSYFSPPVIPKETSIKSIDIKHRVIKAI